MKRNIGWLLLACFLAGCQSDSNDGTEVPEAGVQEKTVETLDVSEEAYRFTAGWLDEETIAYVEHEEGEDRLRRFDIYTGKAETLFTDTAPISEVLIHPSSEQVLIKSASGPGSADIAIIKLNGDAVDELTVESSELEIKWNEDNPELLMITAFEEDWSYEIYQYNTTDGSVTPVQLPDPFPQWLGSNELAYMDGETLMAETISSGQQRILLENVNQFHTAGDQLLAEVFKDGDVIYNVLDAEGKELYQWISDDPVRLLEEAAFIGEGTWIMLSGNTAEEETSLFLTEMRDGERTRRYELGADGGLLDCSPDGEICLSGYSLEQMIQLKTGDTKQWLRFRQ